MRKKQASPHFPRRRRQTAVFAQCACAAAAACLWVVAGCGGSANDGDFSCLAGGSGCESAALVFDFAQGAQGWSAGFADYPAGGEPLYELQAGLRPLPPELGLSGEAFFISGINYSDDLFMYLKRRISGLPPDAPLRWSFRIEIATNSPSGCIGAGGAPGEDVVVKAGAAPIEPLTTVDSLGFRRLNIDKGNQQAGGADAAAIGHIGNSKPCDSSAFELKTLAGDFAGRTDSSGAAWLIIGTDSGFESRSSLYYRRAAIDISLPH